MSEKHRDININPTAGTWNYYNFIKEFEDWLDKHYWWYEQTDTINLIQDEWDELKKKYKINSDN